jgi:hypothetical protein
MDGNFFFLNEIIDNANNPHTNILFTNTKEIEPYEKFAQSKNKNVKINC